MQIAKCKLQIDTGRRGQHARWRSVMVGGMVLLLTVTPVIAQDRSQDLAWGRKKCPPQQACPTPQVCPTPEKPAPALPPEPGREPRPAEPTRYECGVAGTPLQPRERPVEELSR